MQTLVPNVVVPEAHQNDRSYVRELTANTNCELSSHYTRICMIGGYTKDLEKLQNC